MNRNDEKYLNLVKSVITNGERSSNRTGVDTVSVIGTQTHYNIEDGFPCLTTKRIAWKKAIAEMLWFISGDCDMAKGLEDMGAGDIWEPWRFSSDVDSDYGPIYGVQWRKWPNTKGLWGGRFVDQLQNAVDLIRGDPTSRRIIVSSWRPDQIDEMALPPCHVLFQFTVRGEKLHLHLYQRSCDLPIGGPFNIVGYAALLMMVAKITNLTPGTFTHTIHDAHIYVDQLDGIQKQLERKCDAPGPKLIIHGSQREIDDFKLEDFEMLGYKPMPAIKLPVAV